MVRETNSSGASVAVEPVALPAAKPLTAWRSGFAVQPKSANKTGGQRVPERLSALATDTAGKLDVLGHDGHTLGVDGAQ
eukprot:8000679-Pyramimonas_sp.AAC.1